jgi:hypothetical protein
MTKSILKLSLFGLLAIALTGMPAQLHAQESNAPAEKKMKKPAATPFHGKLKAVDKTAKTVSVGETTIQVTSETKIMKAGKPATLDDGVVGEDVAGAYKKAEDGTLNATSVRFGPKPDAPADAKKEETKKDNM